MTTTIILNTSPYQFGILTNKLVSNLIAAGTQVERLTQAIATASENYTGTPGTEFEVQYDTLATPSGPRRLVTGPTPYNASNPQTLFGVQPDTANPGAQGLAYADAVTQLAAAWNTFWDAAKPYLEQLDNGAGIT